MLIKICWRDGFLRYPKVQLLAKEVWRLIHQKDMLLYKVFSAKFFPNWSIFDAPIHVKCSYAWRSIL